MRRLNVNFILGIYLGIIVWWFSLYISGTKDTAVINGFSAVWTAVCAILDVYLVISVINVRKYMNNIYLASSLLFLSLGLTTWCLGNVIWVYYNVVYKIELPFPSYADIMFLGCLPLLLVGVYDLIMYRKYVCVNYSAHIFKRFIAVLLTLFSLFMVFTIFNKDAFTLRVVFNTIFVFMDLVILSILISPVLLKLFFGGFAHFTLGKFIMLFSLLSLLISDIGFFVGTSTGTYYNACFVDLFFLTAQFIGIVAVMYMIKEFYPPFYGSHAGTGANYLIQLPYLRQVSLNCASDLMLPILLYFLVFPLFYFSIHAMVF